MRRPSVTPPLAALALVGSVLPLAVGCTDPCDQLADVCERCTDLTYRDSCYRTVDDNVQGVCRGQKAVFEQTCPPIVDLGTTSGTDTSTTGSSTSTSTTTSQGGGGAAPGGTGGSGGSTSTGGSGGKGGAGGTG